MTLSFSDSNATRRRAALLPLRPRFLSRPTLLSHGTQVRGSHAGSDHSGTGRRPPPQRRARPRAAPHCGRPDEQDAVLRIGDDQTRHTDTPRTWYRRSFCDAKRRASVTQGAHNSCTTASCVTARVISRSTAAGVERSDVQSGGILVARPGIPGLATCGVRSRVTRDRNRLCRRYTDHECVASGGGSS